MTKFFSQSAGNVPDERKDLKINESVNQIPTPVFSFLPCYIFCVAEYTSVLTRLQRYGVGIFAW